jgi:hypothetical protein
MLAARLTQPAFKTLENVRPRSLVRDDCFNAYMRLLFFSDIYLPYVSYRDCCGPAMTLDDRECVHMAEVEHHDCTARRGVDNSIPPIRCPATPNCRQLHVFSRTKTQPFILYISRSILIPPILRETTTMLRESESSISRSYFPPVGPATRERPKLCALDASGHQDRRLDRTGRRSRWARERPGREWEASVHVRVCTSAAARQNGCIAAM